MLPIHSPRSNGHAVAMALFLACTTLMACGSDDDGGTGPSTSSPPDVTIRVSQAIVYGTCEGSSGFDQEGDFIYDIQVFGPASALNLEPALPIGALVEGAAGESVPINLKFVLDGKASEIPYFLVQFEVSERDANGINDVRMNGALASTVFEPGTDGSWDGVSQIISVIGLTPCRIDFVVSLEQ